MAKLLSRARIEAELASLRANPCVPMPAGTEYTLTVLETALLAHDLNEAVRRNIPQSQWTLGVYNVLSRFLEEKS